MSNINWDTIGFDAYGPSTIIFSRFKDGEWSKPEVTDQFSLTLDPFAQNLHYAVSCFEGLKTFTQKSGDVVMFRPTENAARMQRTANYLGIPVPPQELFVGMCAQCVKANPDLVPPYGHQASLYLRPLLLATHPQMQLTPYPEALFVLMCAPAGAYYGANLKSSSAVVPGDFDRAAPKGSGSYKLGANYAATFRPYKMAHEQGYAELLFADSKTRQFVDEFGSSNFFAIKDGKYITPLSDSVLPSITNKSLQQVAADLGLVVEKRPFRVEELSGVEEVGGCGTAVVITPIHRIDFKPVLGEDFVEKSYKYCEPGEVGPVSTKLYKTLTGIQFGELPDIHGWCCKV